MKGKREGRREVPFRNDSEGCCSNNNGTGRGRNETRTCNYCDRNNIWKA